MYIFIIKSIYVYVFEKVFDFCYYEYYIFCFFVYKENRIYSFCEINVLFKVIVVNYIFYNFVESEILGVCIIVFVFIFYDIRKR